MIKDQSIFIQIAETIKSRILSGEYKADERIPSVRDIAVEMEVNPNTVMKSFEVLQRADLIYNKRGMGYFVSTNAFDEVYQERKHKLKHEVIPIIYDEVKLLGMSLDEVIDTFRDLEAHSHS